MAPVVEHHYFCSIPKTPLRGPCPTTCGQPDAPRRQERSPLQPIFGWIRPELASSTFQKGRLKTTNAFRRGHCAGLPAENAAPGMDGSPRSSRGTDIEERSKPRSVVTPSAAPYWGDD